MPCALCSVSGAVEEGADEPDAIGDEIFDLFDDDFDDHAHGDAEPALHAAPPHPPGDDGVPRAVDAPSDSLPTHRVATPRSGLSRRSTVREIGEWVAVTLCQANEDRRVQGVTFSELKATALGPASVTAPAAGQGRVPTLSAHRLFLGALWMANAHNNNQPMQLGTAHIDVDSHHSRGRSHYTRRSAAGRPDTGRPRQRRPDGAHVIPPWIPPHLRHKPRPTHGRYSPRAKRGKTDKYERGRR